MELIFGQYGIELVREAQNWVLKRDYGFSPVQALVASIAACGGYVFDGMMTRSSVPHEFVRVEVNYEVHETRVAPLKSVVIDYYVTMDSSLREKAERIMDLVPKNCPVMQSLNPDIEVVENIHYV